ncbi:MAG: hypothetical protein HYT12_01905 [Candidatus Liptonbacteria bacterium]|nr:hypothetical protein [Candidatus Liptonbacteria bacterium]
MPWNLFEKVDIKKSRSFSEARFVVLSGEFLKSGVALPFGAKHLRAAALREFYLYKGKDFWSKAKITLLRIFNLDFVWWFVFRKKVFVDKNEEIFSFLASKTKFEEPVTFSVYSGSRKYILPIFGEKSGKLLSVAKVYFPGRESEIYGENEAKILDYLQKLDIPGFSFPRVLAKDYFRGALVIILSPPPPSSETKHSNILPKARWLGQLGPKARWLGQLGPKARWLGQLGPKARWLGQLGQNVGMFGGTRGIDAIKNCHLDFLKKLSDKTKEEKIFTESNFYNEIQSELSFLQSKMSNERFKSIKYFFDKAVDNLNSKSFIFSLTKREFPFFEMLCVAAPSSSMFNVLSSKFFVIDWEQARFGFPQIFDLYSLIISGGRFKKGNYVELYERNIQDLFFIKNTKIQSILDCMLKFWNIEKGDAYYFFLLYLVDQLYIHLHVNHELSASRVTALFEKISKNENKFRNNWLP